MTREMLSAIGQLAAVLVGIPFSYSRSRRLDSRRRGQPDENHDAIATGVAAEIGVKIGLPIVERPDVASLINHRVSLAHHRSEAGRLRWWTVQRLAIVQQHLAAGRMYRVTRWWRYWIT